MKGYVVPKNLNKRIRLDNLGVGFSQGVRPIDIVVLRRYGPPKVELKGKAKELANKKGIDTISLSLSDTDNLAVAVAQAIIS